MPAQGGDQLLGGAVGSRLRRVIDPPYRRRARARRPRLRNMRQFVCKQMLP